MGTSNHGLLHYFNGPKAVANGLTRIKMRCAVSLHFQLETNILGVTGVSTGKNLK